MVWQTIPVKHPGASDVKIFDTPGSYSISDIKYPSMKGNITVERVVLQNLLLHTIII